MGEYVYLGSAQYSTRALDINIYYRTRNLQQILLTIATKYLFHRGMITAFYYVSLSSLIKCLIYEMQTTINYQQIVGSDQMFNFKHI